MGHYTVYIGLGHFSFDFESFDHTLLVTRQFHVFVLIAHFALTCVPFPAPGGPRRTAFIPFLSCFAGMLGIL